MWLERQFKCSQVRGRPCHRGCDFQVIEQTQNQAYLTRLIEYRQKDIFYFSYSLDTEKFMYCLG